KASIRPSGIGPRVHSQCPALSGSVYTTMKTSGSRRSMTRRQIRSFVRSFACCAARTVVGFRLTSRMDVLRGTDPTSEARIRAISGGCVLSKVSSGASHPGITTPCSSESAQHGELATPPSLFDHRPIGAVPTEDVQTAALPSGAHGSRYNTGSSERGTHDRACVGTERTLLARRHLHRGWAIPVHSHRCI